MEEILNKPTLQLYREGKTCIGYDNCYRNTRRSEYLAKARMNSLQLEEHLGRGNPNYDKKCKLCHIEEKNLEHFLGKCLEKTIEMASFRVYSKTHHQAMNYKRHGLKYK